MPRFEMIKAADLRSYEWQSHDADEVTIDGYTWYEIKKYHQREHSGRHAHYHPATCCVSPIIVLDSEFVNSGTLERHELSSIFGDMPADDFAQLKKSVEQDGFMDYVIRMHEGKILDGWHRYRAALELNLVRKLMFNPWDAEKEGAAVAFVAARNIERRHLSASQRAQIVVSLNERFGWGGDRSKTPNDALKTKAELAAEAKVGISTIDRAVKVEKAGESEAVISGEKTATKVIAQREAEKLEKRKKQVCKLMWDTRQEATRIYIGDGDTDLNQWLSLLQLEKGFEKNNPSYAAAFVSAMQRTTFFSLQNCIDKMLESKVDVAVLDKEHRALMTYVGDLRLWERQDWSPDTNWIQLMIQAKKDAESQPAPKPEPEPKPEPDDLNTLWEKVTAQMPKWKQKYKESGYRETERVSRASKSMLIQALRAYRESEASDAATIEELKDLLHLLKSQSYPLAYHLRKICGGTTDDQTPAETEETCPETDSEDPEADTSLDDLYLSNLVAVLQTLMKTVGRVEHSITRNNLMAALNEAFEPFEGISEREQLSILIDCAHTIVRESAANA